MLVSSEVVAMSVKQVDDGLIDSVHLLVPKFWLLRWDVGPFVVGHAVLFYFLYHADIYHQHFHTQQNLYLQSFDSLELQCALVGIPLLLTLQMVIFLISQWNTHLRVSLGHDRVTHIDQATSVHIVASNNVGNDKIVDMHMIPTIHYSKDDKLTVGGKVYHLRQKFFEFQKMRYEYVDDKGTFMRLEYPTSGHVSKFLTSKGK